MIDFKNAIFYEQELASTDCFICCVGYELRSYFLLDKVKKVVEANKITYLTVNDYDELQETYKNRVNEIKNTEKSFFEFDYYNDLEVQNVIVKKFIELKRENSKVRMDIDYSSMPRGWYGRLPELLCDYMDNFDEVFFWYSEGEYTEHADDFTTVGIDSAKVYAGKPSLHSKKQRTHLMGVGFDSIRTQGIISLLDPDNYIICEAFNPERRDIHDEVVRANASIIEQTSICVSLYVNDIEFMLAKLMGIVNEYYYSEMNDIILVPDGPKPLIFCMSMIPWLFGKPGVSCIHIMRNSNSVKRKDILPVGSIIGFSLKKVK